jgi:hypothetical protein
MRLKSRLQRHAVRLRGAFADFIRSIREQRSPLRVMLALPVPSA